MNIKNNLHNIMALQKATAAMQAANDPIARIKAGTRLIELLKSMGLYDQNQDAIIGDSDATEDEYSDNTNAENYRYADTGYIAGSHKEKASKRIKDLAKDGHTVKASDIEWDEIEADPLFAEDVIQKSNIIGEIDYQAMKDAGGDAGTAFIIQKVFAAIGTKPHWDMIEFFSNSITGKRMIRPISYGDRERIFKDIESNVAERQKLARKAYVNGINSLKARISGITDVRSLVAELKEIAAEMGGANVSAATTKEYEVLDKRVAEVLAKIQKKSGEYEAEYKAAEDKALESMELPKTTKRHGVGIPIYKGGEFIPFATKNSYYLRRKSMLEWLKEKHPDVGFSEAHNTRIAMISTVKGLMAYKLAIDDLELLTFNAGLAGLKDPNANLAWVSLGERFWNVIEFTSGSFVKHANMALNKKYDDWALTIKDDSAAGDNKGTKKGKTKTTFELIVADKIERIGGREVEVRSTEELKDTFGFRDIQSGNWVLKDKAIAKFHVESAAAAMMDLSDVVGIDAKSLAFGGRLALALGARGKKGAMAHYEPVARVINLSKMKGGGSLGHEWFHAIDNILGEVLGIDGATSAGTFLSDDSSILGDHPLNAAFDKLREAMLVGDTRAPEQFKVTQKNIDMAQLNIKADKRTPIVSIIMDNTAEQAVIEIDKRMSSRYGIKRTSNHTAWRNIAVAYHHQNHADATVILNTGDPVSNFYAESQKLDMARSKPYWSSKLEMAARSFQAFLEDSLKDQERRNDYLSFGADNNLYKSHKAYPAGEERKKINRVFAELFKVIKDEKVFENALKDEAMMDAIFGAESLLFDDEQQAFYELFNDEGY